LKLGDALPGAILIDRPLKLGDALPGAMLFDLRKLGDALLLVGEIVPGMPSSKLLANSLPSFSYRIM
jgi:hypothetical protein